jgi:hypothetical protein
MGVMVGWHIATKHLIMLVPVDFTKSTARSVPASVV